MKPSLNFLNNLLNNLSYFLFAVIACQKGSHCWLSLIMHNGGLVKFPWCDEEYMCLLTSTRNVLIRIFLNNFFWGSEHYQLALGHHQETGRKQCKLLHQFELHQQGQGNQVQCLKFQKGPGSSRHGKRHKIYASKVCAKIILHEKVRKLRQKWILHKTV